MSSGREAGPSASAAGSIASANHSNGNAINGNRHQQLQHDDQMNTNRTLPPLQLSDSQANLNEQDQLQSDHLRHGGRPHPQHRPQPHLNHSQSQSQTQTHYSYDQVQPQQVSPAKRRTAFPLEESSVYYPPPAAGHPSFHHQTHQPLNPHPGHLDPNMQHHHNQNQVPPPPHYHSAQSEPTPYSHNASYDHQYPTNHNQSMGSSSHIPPQEEMATTVIAPPPLLRNQACLSCRRRKMKCDAVRPVCGTCARSKAAAASAKQGHAPVPPGPCVYETVKPKVKSATPAKRKRRSTAQDGSAESPASSQPAVDPIYVQELEQRLKSMQEIIDHQASRFDTGLNSGSSNPRNRSHTEPNQILNNSSNGSNSGNSDYGADNNWARTSSASGNGMRSVPATTIATDMDRDHGSVPVFGMLASDDSGTTKRVRRQFNTRAMPPPSSSTKRGGSANSGYSHLGPSPSDSAGSIPASAPRIGGPPEADPLLEILFPGYPSDLPSPDTVHHLAEIFFSKCPLSSAIHRSTFMTGLSLPMKHRQRPNEALVHAIMAVAAPLSPYFEGSRPSVRRERMNNQNDYSGSSLGRGGRSRKELYDPRASSFAEFHLQRSKAKHAKALTQPHSPLDRCHSGLICAYILWGTTRFIEAFTENAQVQRTLLPTGLTRLGLVRTKYRVPAIIPPPSCDAEEHERRLLFWWCYITDVYNGGAGFLWEPLLNDDAIITTLPAETELIQAGREVKPNPQTLHSSDLFTAGHVDDFSLHVKSCILLKRVYLLHSRSPVEENHLRKPQGFKAIETSIMDFTQSFPPEDPFSAVVSVDRLLGWCNTQLALVLLHEPFITSPELECESYGKVSVAVNNTLGVVQKLRATSFDFGLLHPQLFLCWLVVGRMICKEIERQRTTGAPGEEAAPETVDALDVIISALYRAAEFIPCAARCFHLLQRFRSGKLSEEMLAVCMYVEGLIPTDEDDILFPEDNLPSVPEALVQPQSSAGFPGYQDPREAWQGSGYDEPSSQPYYPPSNHSMQYPPHPPHPPHPEGAASNQFPSTSAYLRGPHSDVHLDDATAAAISNPTNIAPASRPYISNNHTQSVEERYHNERSQTQMPASLQASNPPHTSHSGTVSTGRDPQTFDDELPVWTLHYGDSIG